MADACLDPATVRAPPIALVNLQSPSANWPGDSSHYPNLHHEPESETLRHDALPRPVHDAPALSDSERPALPDLSLGPRRTRRAGLVARPGATADSALSRRQYRPDHSRRGSAVPSEK